MTTSSSSALDRSFALARGLDMMLLDYCVFDGHPAL